MVLVQNGQSCFKGICLFSNSIDLYDFLHDVRGPYAQRYSMIDLHSCLLQIRIKGVIMDLEAALLSFYLNSLVRFSWFFTRRKRWLLKSNVLLLPKLFIGLKLVKIKTSQLKNQPLLLFFLSQFFGGFLFLLIRGVDHCHSKVLFGVCREFSLTGNKKKVGKVEPKTNPISYSKTL